MSATRPPHLDGVQHLRLLRRHVLAHLLFQVLPHAAQLRHHLRVWVRLLLWLLTLATASSCFRRGSGRDGAGGGEAGGGGGLWRAGGGGGRRSCAGCGAAGKRVKEQIATRLRIMIVCATPTYLSSGAGAGLPGPSPPVALSTPAGRAGPALIVGLRTHGVAAALHLGLICDMH